VPARLYTVMEAPALEEVSYHAGKHNRRIDRGGRGLRRCQAGPASPATTTSRVTSSDRLMCPMLERILGIIPAPCFPDIIALGFCLCAARRVPT